MTLVIGIDPSLSGMAVASASGGEVAPMAEYVARKGATKLPVRERIQAFEAHAIRAARWPTQAHVFLEGYSFGSPQKAAYLGEFGAVLRTAILQNGHTLTEVTPTMLKRFAAGKGNANKPTVISELTKRYGQTFDTDNKADAYALLRIGMCVVGIDEPQTKAQVQVVEALRTKQEVSR